MSIENFFIILNKRYNIIKMTPTMILYLFILSIIEYIKAFQIRRNENITSLNCNLIDNCFECSYAHLNEKNCKWINQKCENSTIKYSETWFDNFKECEVDKNLMINIKQYCTNDISKHSQIIINKFSERNDVIGSSNIYCLIDVNNIKTNNEVIISLSKSQESLYSNDNYGLVIYYKNGERQILFLENKNYLLKERNINNIEFRYYSQNPKSQSPFLLTIQYESKHFFLLMKYICVIIFIFIFILCVVACIIFYRWRISIIKKNENLENKNKKEKEKKNIIENNKKELNNNKIENKIILNQNNNQIILTLNNNNSIRELKEIENTENIDSIITNSNFSGGISCYINGNLEKRSEIKSNQIPEIKINIRKERRNNTVVNNFTH